MTRSDKLGTLIEHVALSLYYEDEYSICENVEDVYDWEDTFGLTKIKYREKALSVLRALDLGYEWGVQTSDHIGNIETTYANEDIARIVFEELEDEEPERDPKLIRRIVGPWEETK